MNVNNIDPRRLKIYGHGGRALPLLVSENEHFDPPQVSIQVIGEEDGSFDNNDSVLFYAESIYGFVEENNSNINPYAERAYYSITADGDLGNRIFPFTQPTGTPDVTFTTFDDYKFVEEDRFSPVLVGRRWFGDRFDVENDRTYEFDFPNIVNSEQMLVKVYAADTVCISIVIAFISLECAITMVCVDFQLHCSTSDIQDKGSNKRSQDSSSVGSNSILKVSRLLESVGCYQNTTSLLLSSRVIFWSFSRDLCRTKEKTLLYCHPY